MAGDGRVIAASRAMGDVLAVLEQAVKTSLPVLLFGESGVGKHCLVEYALRVRGFSGPVPTDSAGGEKGETNCSGTLIVYDLDRLGPEGQQKLLDRLKSSPELWVIATASGNLETAVEDGGFNAELYYRMSVFPLFVPPLRNRKEDIRALGEVLLQKWGAAVNKAYTGFDQDAAAAMCSYGWPGNIRELENAVARACTLGEPPVVHAVDLRLKTALAGDDLIGIGGNGETLRAAVRRFKKAYVSRVLGETGWNQTRACKILGIQRTYLSRLLYELQLRR
ncbi:MAG: sigma 54-interacting transcriptional regulator [Spirochaetaceae bacterium]|jgi:Nif-specific regulatory protein|nr:sigma 54-interacting transcriptional regulator [Spirochaetaceae bacterium]